MNKPERIKMVKAMEFIARQINNEDVFDGWLLNGVADGDIKYGDLSVKPADLEDLDCYTGDENFSDLMWEFTRLISRARQKGGLHCDGVSSDDYLAQLG